MKIEKKKSAEGSDPVLLNYLAFAWSFGFLGYLREGEKERNSTLWAMFLVSPVGAGSNCRIILCYYEPLPYHVQATKDAMFAL